MKGSLIIVGFFIVGTLVGVFDVMPSLVGDISDISFYALCALMFFVGVSVGGDAGFRARIDVVDIEETVAVVRVLEEQWGGRIDFTDYLLMMKMDGRWRCVAKAYNQNSNTIQK